MGRDPLEDAEHQTVMAILRLLSQMSAVEQRDGKEEAMYALNRAWHAINDKKYKKFLKGE